MAEYLPDRIFAPANAVRAIAERDGTPFYLYHKSGILDGIQSLHREFSWAQRYQNYFHIRENNNPEILKLLCAAGTGVSACSYTELLLAQTCGFRGEQLLYEPSRRDEKAETLAHKLQATWLINGEYLLPETLPEQIILRYHASQERLTVVKAPKIKTSKNGFVRNQLLSLLSHLHKRGVKKLGVALQVASYSVQEGFWEKRVELLVALAQEVSQKLGFNLWCFHLGEGTGLAYRPRETAPDLPTEAERVRVCLEQAGISPVICTGVNRQLLEHHGILVTQVLEIRNSFMPFLILDAGMSQFIRPILKKAYRHISVLGRNDEEGRKLYYPCGELPDEADRLCLKGRMLPELTPGDYCVLHDVGIGSRSMAMLYGTHCLAGEYLLEEDGTIRLIAPRREEEEVLRFLTAW